MVKVSIILPVYNVGKYLDETFQSLLNQTLKEIEKCNGLMDSLDFKLISREDVPRMPPLVEKYHKYEKRLNRVQELKNSKKIK